MAWGNACPTFSGVGGSAFFTIAGCSTHWAGHSGPHSTFWGQGKSLTLFEPWISVAGAAVEGAALTHCWGMDRAALQGKASKIIFEKSR